jgi:competence protein ComEC
MVFDGKSIFWLNSPLGDFDFDSIEVDFLIISNNSVKNLDQLHGLVSANQVILDKSNSFYTQRSLLEGAKENQVDIHQVSANGYFSSLWRK